VVPRISLRTIGEGGAQPAWPRGRPAKAAGTVVVDAIVAAGGAVVAGVVSTRDGAVIDAVTVDDCGDAEHAPNSTSATTQLNAARLR